MVKKSDKHVNGGELSYRAPDHLGRLAATLWRKVTGFLEENAAVNRIDTQLVEMYCTQYEIYRNAYEHIKEHGEVQGIYKTLQDFEGKKIGADFVGYKRNPMTQIYDSSLKNLTKLGSELGLSPKSRAELMSIANSIETNTSDDDAIAKFFDDNDGEF